MKNITSYMDSKTWKLLVQQLLPEIELQIDSKCSHKADSYIYWPLRSNIWENFQNILELKK
jgi:hypothetical protein